eukprot:3864552-Ditylum_brightwellii.AAC.1
MNDAKQANKSYWNNFALIKNSNLLSNSDNTKLSKKRFVTSCAEDKPTSSKHQSKDTVNSDDSGLHGAALNDEVTFSPAQQKDFPPNPLDSEE